MKNKQIVVKILPYLVALLCFTALCTIYFAPQFNNKEIVMHDMVQYSGMSKEIIDHRESYKEDPQWTGSMFGGMPAPLITMKHDSTIIKSAIYSVMEFMGRPASLIFIAMVSFFIMLLLFGLSPWVAIVPALAYGLSTYFFIIIGAGHITKMVSLAYAPLMVGSLAYTFRGNIWLGAALTALFASLLLLGYHPQIAYYFLFVMVAFWINEGVKAIREHTIPRFAKITGLLAIAAILAVGSNLAPLWYINEYGKVSMRGGKELVEAESTEVGKGLSLDYVTAWSYGKTESFNMFIPNLMGGASDEGFSSDGEVARSLAKYNQRGLATQLPTYWGDQPITSGPTYLGAVVIYLAVLGLFLLRGRAKWWLVALSVLAIMLAWGKNFIWLTELFYNYFPAYNKFRTVSMILVIVEWSVPLLGALVLHKIWRGGATKKEVVKGALNALYVTGGVALFFILLGGVFMSFSGGYDAQMGLPDDIIAAMQDERASMMRMDALRSLLFVGLAAGVITLFAKEKIRRWGLILLLGLLVCADLIPINLRYLPQSRFVDSATAQIKPTEANLEIMRDKSLGYRVLNTTLSPFNDAITSYFHRSVGGYHGAKMQRYQDVIDRYLSQNNWEVYNMLNTKYIIVAQRESGKQSVKLNGDANGSAWFVERVRIAQSPNEEIDELGKIDTKTEAVVEQRFAHYIEGLDLNEEARDETQQRDVIEMVEYRANKVVYDYSLSEESLAIFSEIYYDKGWKAYLDGEPVPHFRANYILRAMVLPAGEHRVEFKYRADSYGTISGITLLCSIVIIAGVVVSATMVIIKGRRRRRDAGE